MSRQPVARNLTLTEELEKLEQSITLTLQEIDSNFSAAHRIVTTSILPIVEQYAKHSADVWDGSKFWKHFFEASANVSLSGYEEAAVQDEEEDTLQTETTSTNLDTPTDHDEYLNTNTQQQQHTTAEDDDDEFSVDSPTQMTGLQTTPRINSSRKAPTITAFRSPSPRKYTGRNPLARDNDPSTPRPQSSPFEPHSAAYNPSAQPRTTTNDPLMHHHILDKNYRIAATPHTTRRHPPTATKPTPTTTTRQPLFSSSPTSSPSPAAPQLRSDLFSPAKQTRTPGVSVLTPARGKSTAAGIPTTSTGRKLFSPQDKTTAARKSSHYFSDSDEEEDDDMGMSPPKTMQFHVPQSRLMQTPAREASKRIVDDLLLTAGADLTDDIEGLDDLSVVDEPSPSVVRRMVEDDTF